ncbi:glutamine--fructose-6-phosphate transaminase (isomerizing) [bacterium CG17_big_fil_post_rev_8_21_14_2_50_64_8]|nr:MAG: glutamine--fructose-6-phosphate transaminase (isomerizing) [bacterium CG17_big_fil_post_rev_8_21_14_2_50_64_8]PJA74233.1 MAG: glutamine--fructose-6-phosphate transaminase (isomerizing) [bacterium CG_4_9_14_3_um_filter_65_15]
MCGIVGVTGSADALKILIEGLKRLEYRGYDSAGVAIVRADGQHVVKEKGKIAALVEACRGQDLAGSCGIAHTRWATHGAPTRLNAHPHTSGAISIVHNGIIENHNALRARLVKKGTEFTSDTDSEVLAHLIADFYTGDLVDAVQRALSVVEGAFGVAITHSDHPEMVVGARKGSPLVVGVGDGVNFLASDVAAIMGHTRQVIYLDDGEMVTLTPEGVSVTTIGNEEITKEIQEITWDLDQIQKGGYEHFMLKEIFEQPQTIRDSFRGRILPESGDVKLGGIQLTDWELRNIRRIIILACGTSWHAGLVGEYLIEEYAGIPVEVEYASEFRYRSPIIDPGTLCLVISQSGETIDTLEAMREAKRKGAKVLGITNVVGSTIARESECGVYIHAGPEIGVASTKAFTSQVTILALMTLLLGRRTIISADRGTQILKELEAIPGKVQKVLDQSDAIRDIARVYAKHKNCLYLGRGVNFPIALEGALKLKEISYIHAEGYPAAEMKHGPIALIDPEMPVVVIAIKDGSYDKIVGNVQEVRARDGKIISIVTEGDEEIAALSDHVITIPDTTNFWTPLLSVIPLQLLAYHIAVLRGEDVDQPRNLAKAVTVE